MKTYNNRNVDFWNTILSAPQIEEQLHITMHQLMETMRQGELRLVILNDINPLLNYSDMKLSLYLSKTSGFMASADGDDHQVIRPRSQTAVDHFNRFFCHLKELDASFITGGGDACDFIERGIDFA